MWLRWLIRPRGCEEAQSLVETAIAMPLLLGLAFNIINFGYFWFMVLSLAAAPRMGAEYSTQGGDAISLASAPSTTLVSTLVYDNITKTIRGATTTNTAVRVCSATSAAGVNSSTGIAGCDSFGASFSFPANTADPEAPTFVLNRVDVEYTVKPIISGAAFNVILPANLNFQRHVSMRSLY
jgi:Flp pilus assembly protein TadG